MGNPQPWPLFQVSDVNGKPVSGAKIYTYIPSTTNDQLTYSNNLRTIPNANPVVADSYGQALIYLIGPTKFYVTDSVGNEIRTIEWVGDDTLNFYNASSYGSAGTQAAITAALAAIGATNATLYLPPATWVITASATIPANVNLKLEGGALFNVNTGQTLTIKGPIEAVPNQTIFTWAGTGAVELSYSPTADIPLNWFGGVNGIAVNDSAAWSKAAASIGYNQTIWVHNGISAILSNTVISKVWGMAIKGDNQFSSAIYINTPGNEGLVLGNTSAGSYNLRLSDISFIGPATCCTYGLHCLNWHDIRIDRVNFHLGATQYAAWFDGVLFLETDHLQAGRDVPIGGTLGLPAASFKVTDNATVGNNNVINMHVVITGNACGTGVYCKNASPYGNIFSLTGSIENCASNPMVYVEGMNMVNLHDVYGIDADNVGPIIVNCRAVRISNFYSGGDATLTKVWGDYIQGCNFNTLTIEANCRGITLSNIGLGQPNGLIDHSPDTKKHGIYELSSGTCCPQVPNSTPDRINFINNAYFTRFLSGGNPDGWSISAMTWDQCGTSLGDTTNHKSPYCAKFTTSGGDGSSAYTLSAETLKALLGKIVNFSVWQKIGAAQTFDVGKYPIIYLDVTCPAWVASTAYTIGQGVIPSAGANGFNYICSVAGTSGTAPNQPTWPTTIGGTVTDNGITWTAYPASINSFATMPGVAGDIGVWKQVVVSNTVPTNATAVSPWILVYRQTGGSNAYVYFAEPALMVGWEGPDAMVPGQNEVFSFLQIGANTLSYAASIPTSGSYRQGDLVYNNAGTKDASSMTLLGWYRLTTGANHASGTDWALMYVSHVTPAA